MYLGKVKTNLSWLLISSAHKVFLLERNTFFSSKKRAKLQHIKVYIKMTDINKWMRHMYFGNVNF